MEATRLYSSCSHSIGGSCILKWEQPGQRRGARRGRRYLPRLNSTPLYGHQMCQERRPARPNLCDCPPQPHVAVFCAHAGRSPHGWAVVLAWRVARPPLARVGAGLWPDRFQTPRRTGRPVYFQGYSARAWGVRLKSPAGVQDVPGGTSQLGGARGRFGALGVSGRRWRRPTEL
jgi:hypothetical protein